MLTIWMVLGNPEALGEYHDLLREDDPCTSASCRGWNHEEQAAKNYPDIKQRSDGKRIHDYKPWVLFSFYLQLSCFVTPSTRVAKYVAFSSPCKIYTIPINNLGG